MAVKKEAKSGRPEQDIRASRRAAGINVLVSVVVATALLVVVNVIGNVVSGKHNLRWNVETLGRYRLSETAKRILDQVRRPIRLTSIYTSTKPDRRAQKYKPALMDLLEEMRRWNRDLRAVDVTSERDKAELVGRLRSRLNAAAQQHRLLISNFQELVRQQTPRYESEAREWRAYPQAGFLARLGLPKAIETDLNGVTVQLDEASRDVRKELNAADLPDYLKLVRRVRLALNGIGSKLAEINRDLAKLGELGENAEAVRSDLTASTKAVTTELEKAVRAAGSPGSPEPKDPGKLLETVAEAALAAAKSAEMATRPLGDLDAQSGRKLQNLRSWQASAAHLTQIINEAGNIAAQAQTANTIAKAEVQKSFITQQLRPALPQLLNTSKQAQAAVEQMLAELTGSDEATRKTFQQPEREAFLKGQLERVDALLAQADGLSKAKPRPASTQPATQPATEPTTRPATQPTTQPATQPAETPDQRLQRYQELIENIGEDNIVLVEVGDQAPRVVGFDDVWPLAPRAEAEYDTAGEEEPRRIFHGDMAIRSTILNMISDPFAEVVLTYLESDRLWGVGPIASRKLQALRERLEKANIKVKEWNLAYEDSPPKPELDQVLLVLPLQDPVSIMEATRPKDTTTADPRMEQFREYAIREYRSLIDNGVKQIQKLAADGTPAVFLAGWLEPYHFIHPLTPQEWYRLVIVPKYYWSDYLRDQWGLEVKTQMRVVLGRRDSLEPDKFVLSRQAWERLPLSSFSATHPVGRPLRARRFYWASACPVLEVPDSKAAAKVAEILTADVPPGRQSLLWASASPMELSNRIEYGRTSGVEPSTEKADILPPFPLVVEATKTIDGKTARVMVLGVGLSYSDDVLRAPIWRARGPDRASAEPPPTGNVDLIVNGVYHLVGKDEYIGAGPAIVQPIEIEPRTMTFVQIVFGLVWPALMLMVGGLVMFIRRR